MRRAPLVQAGNGLVRLPADAGMVAEEVSAREIRRFETPHLIFDQATAGLIEPKRHWQKLVAFFIYPALIPSAEKLFPESKRRSSAGRFLQLAKKRFRVAHFD